MSSPARNEKSRFSILEVDCPPNLDFQHDHASTFWIDMSLIHNVFIRCLNSVYYYALRVKKGKDEAAFAGYCLTFTDLLHAHHLTEEEIIFPFLQSKVDMNHNQEQHARFVPQLNDFEAYMRGVKRKEEVYDGEKVRKFLDAFGDDLVEHLHDEIPTISPEQLKQFDKPELDAMFERLNKHLKKTGRLTTSVVLVLTHHNTIEIPSWPPLPKPVKGVIKNIAYWRHRRYWKFSPFTRNSKPLVYSD